MNDYRITYTTSRDEQFSETVTERSEAAARKCFTAFNRGKGLTITNVELIRENTCATKQQERDTLEAIKKMVAELGPQSYLATAFDGCFEDAEQNIENDFGDSYFRRCESLEKQLDEAQQEIEQLRDKLSESEKGYEAAHAISEQKDKEIAALRQRILPVDDLTDCRQMAENLVEELRRKVKAAEATILEYAEHPETTTFVDAVRERRSLTSDIEYYEALTERIRSIEVTA